MTGYSAAVRLWVTLDGERIDIGQVGGGRIYFDEPRTVRAGPATLTVEVDGDAAVHEINIIGEPGPATVFRFEKTGATA